MKFEYTKEDCTIIFEEHEKEAISKNGKLIFDYINMKHFLNHLSHVITESHRKFLSLDKKEVMNQITFEETEVKTK
jgi:hypothetical protein